MVDDHDSAFTLFDLFGLIVNIVANRRRTSSLVVIKKLFHVLFCFFNRLSLNCDHC